MSATPARPARSRVRPAVAALVAAALASALTGCGGDPEPVAGQDASGASTSSDASDASVSPSVSPSDSPSDSPSVSPSDSPSDTADADAPDAAQGELAGEGYALTLPPGWQEATSRFQEYSPLIDTGAVNAAQAGQPFSDNVNVLRNADQPRLALAQAERQFADELGTVASGVRVQDRATVDGAEAIHLTGRTDAGEVTAVTDQYISWVDGAYYVITFSYDTSTPRGQRRDEVAAMLRSWTWD